MTDPQVLLAAARALLAAEGDDAQNIAAREFWRAFAGTWPANLQSYWQPYPQPGRVVVKTTKENRWTCMLGQALAIYLDDMLAEAQNVVEAAP